MEPSVASDQAVVRPRFENPLSRVADWLSRYVGPGGLRSTQLFFINIMPIIMIWTLSGSHLITTHHEMAYAAERETARIAMTVEQNARRTVNEVDRTVRYARELYGQLGDSQAWANILERQFVSSQIIAQVAAVDRNGRLISSTQMPAPPDRIDLSDRQHVRVHMADTADKLFISAPVLGRLTGKWTIQFTRPFYDVAGVFAGVIVVSLHVDYLAAAYKDLDLDNQSGVALLGRDNVIRAGRGRFAGELGKTMPESVLRAAETGVSPSITPLATLLGSERLAVTVLHDLGDVPLRIVLENRNAAAQSLWQANARFNIFTSFILSLGSFALTSMFVRRRLEYEQRLHELVYYDSLTGLPNRRSFMQSLTLRCQQARSGNEGEDEVFLFLIGIDRMKQINDRQGQSAGDAVLNQCAKRLARVFGDASTLVGRLGGDEFAILSPAGPEDCPNATCEKIIALLREPIEFERQRLVVGCGVGAVKMKLAADSIPALMHAVTFALQEVKRRGGNTYQLFDSKLNARLERDNQIEAALIVALEERALDVHYQPVVCSRSHRCIGYEALVRWRRHDGTFISPAEFVPLAEARGLIGDLDRFVIDRVCSEAHRLIERPDMGISINVSARELHNGQITDFLRQCTKRYGVDPANIRIEITETAILDNVDSAVMQLRLIREQGFHILLDDFGTGYSSLSYLLTFPVSAIKIDRSFVHGITCDARDKVIVSAIVHIARGLGLRVVAEGVEEAQEAALLEAMGVDYLQGYHFGRPAPLPPLETAAAAG